MLADVGDDAAPRRYRLRQSFRYDYDAPALSLQHRLVVIPPPVHADQRLRLGVVQVSEPAQVDWQTDGHGNRVCTVRVPVVQRSLSMSVEVVVDRGGAAEPQPPGLAHDRRLLDPSLLTLANPALLGLARRHAGGADQLAAAGRVCELVRHLVDYQPDATTVRTTAAEALAGGAGVCQDQAHVMLSICRAAGIACRYVSGHLIGQGGTHAWVEVAVPEGVTTRVVAFDPCHARTTDLRYVTIAVGRDYSDVAPTSGWYSGRAVGRLTGTRELLAETLAA